MFRVFFWISGLEGFFSSTPRRIADLASAALFAFRRITGDFENVS